MGLIYQRILLLDGIEPEPYLVQTETLALHLRKIVEGIGFLALSASELKNKQQLLHLRTKAPVDILAFLKKRGILRLPEAQDIGASPDPEAKGQFTPRPDRDLSLGDLDALFSSTSSIVHERHPERLNQEVVAKAHSNLLLDAQRIRRWLWLHRMHFGEAGLLVQMAEFGTPHFVQAYAVKARTT